MLLPRTNFAVVTSKIKVVEHLTKVDPVIDAPNDIPSTCFVDPLEYSRL